MLALLNEKTGNPEIARAHYTKGLEASQNPGAGNFSDKTLDAIPAKLLIHKN